MKNRFLFLLVLLFAFGAVPYVTAEDVQVIRLKDGSVIRGHVVELKDNVYRINTQTLGEVKVDADKVLVIAKESEYVDPQQAPAPQIREGFSRQRDASHRSSPRLPANSVPTPAPAGSDVGHQQNMVNDQVKSMMQDGNFLNKMMDLGSNPAMEEVMSDPELMDAINNMDYQTLMNSEKMQRLMDSQDTQDLLGGMDQ